MLNEFVCTTCVRVGRRSGPQMLRRKKPLRISQHQAGAVIATEICCAQSPGDYTVHWRIH
jgi:hypothetical protein